jgi:DNA-binding transcriptional LysR family regulator
MRKSFRDQLFVKTSSGMQATPRADELVKSCREILASLRALTTDTAEFRPEHAERIFRISMTDASHITLLPLLFSHVNTMAPTITLEPVPINTTTGQQLQSGDSDLAMGFLPELEAGFYQQVLYMQDWVCLVNRNHPRIQKSLDIDHYLKDVHIDLSIGSGYRLAEDTLHKFGINRRILLRLPGFLGLSSIISSTNLIATVPKKIAETLAANSNGIRVFPCPVDIPSFPVKLYWHSRYHNDSANRWIRRICVQLFQK